MQRDELRARTPLAVCAVTPPASPRQAVGVPAVNRLTACNGTGASMRSRVAWVSRSRLVKSRWLCISPSSAALLRALGSGPLLDAAQGQLAPLRAGRACACRAGPPAASSHGRRDLRGTLGHVDDAGGRYGCHRAVPRWFDRPLPYHAARQGRGPLLNFHERRDNLALGGLADYGCISCPRTAPPGKNGPQDGGWPTHDVWTLT